MSVQNTIQKSALYLRKHSPAILTCLGAAGVIATAVMSVRSTPKAMQLLAAATDEKGEALTKAETIIVAGPSYIPAAMIGLSTIVCILGANTLNHRQQASLMSAYTMLHRSYRQYRNAANKVFGEDADSKIQVELASDANVFGMGLFESYSLYSLDEDQHSERVTFYDSYSDRYFETTMAAVLNAQYHTNRNLWLRGDVPMNEFYEFLGIDGIENGDSIGWTTEEMFDWDCMWLDFDNKPVKLDGGMACYIMTASFEPHPIDYEKD